MLLFVACLTLFLKGTKPLTFGLQPTLYLWATATVALTSTCWFEGCRNWVWSEPKHVLGKDLAIIASKWRLSKIEVWRNRFALESINLIHFRGKFRTKSHECFRINVAHFIPKTSHHRCNVGWSRIPVNALRPHRPVSLNIIRSFPPKTCSGSLHTQFQQPSNQQVFVNTTVVVAQR